MQKLFLECQQIYRINYLENGETMIATSSVLQNLQENLNVIKVRDSVVSYDFILRGQHGLFTRSVTYVTRMSRRDEFDKNKVCTEVGNATRAVRKFFKQKEFAHCVMGLNLGNAWHDMAVFIKKNGKAYDLVHFDPNEQTSSKTMDEFQKSLSKNTTRRGYHPKGGNSDGKCSYLTWMELLEFILLNKNPFMSGELLEYDTLNRTY